MKLTQQGFTLFEVMISLFIAAVAVLGLVMLELTILRSAQSSFNYTLATIEAHTLADKIWMNMCDIEADETRFLPMYNEWVSDLSDSTNDTSFTGALSDSLSTNTLSQTDTISVSWVDKNFAADTNNDQAILTVNLPDFTGLCL